MLVGTRPGASALALTALRLSLSRRSLRAMQRSATGSSCPCAGPATRRACRLGLAIAGGAQVDTSTVVIALVAVAVMLIAAGATALVLRRDVPSRSPGGTRDPIVAIALAWSAGGAEATGVPP